MGDQHGDLLGEAERNRRTMARVICHRSPSAGVEAMVAVVDGRRRRAAAGLRIVLLIIRTIPTVGFNEYFFDGRRSKNRFPTARILF